MKTVALALFMIIGSALGATAQQTTTANGGTEQTVRQRMSREQLAEVQARHIAKAVGLDEALTKKYVATYCDSQKEIWSLGPRMKRDSSMEDRFDRSRKVIDIREKYYKKYKSFLTDDQIDQVYKEERRVMQHMMQGKKGGPKGRQRKG